MDQGNHLGSFGTWTWMRDQFGSLGGTSGDLGLVGWDFGVFIFQT